MSLDPVSFQFVVVDFASCRFARFSDCWNSRSDGHIAFVSASFTCSFAICSTADWMRDCLISASIWLETCLEICAEAIASRFVAFSSNALKYSFVRESITFFEIWTTPHAAATSRMSIAHSFHEPSNCRATARAWPGVSPAVCGPLSVTSSTRQYGHSANRRSVVLCPHCGHLFVASGINFIQT